MNIKKLPKMVLSCHLRESIGVLERSWLIDQRTRVGRRMGRALAKLITLFVRRDVDGFASLDPLYVLKFDPTNRCERLGGFYRDEGGLARSAKRTRLL